MRRFKFRFEKILTYRGHQEKQRQRELASALNVQQSQQEKVSGLVRGQMVAQKEKEKHLVGKIETARLSGYYRYGLRLKHLEMAGRELLGHIAKDVEKKRQTLVEAARKKKTYEKLKERHLRQYTEDSNLALQKENDEIGQKMFVINR